MSGLIFSCDKHDKSLNQVENSNDKNGDETNTTSTGLILGYDPAMCMCCGGWIIQIEDSDEPYRFYNLPDNSGIDLEHAIFPISVEFSWHLDLTCGSIHILIIEKIELI